MTRLLDDERTLIAQLMAREIGDLTATADQAEKQARADQRKHRHDIASGRLAWAAEQRHTASALTRYLRMVACLNHSSSSHVRIGISEPEDLWTKLHNVLAGHVRAVLESEGQAPSEELLSEVCDNALLDFAGDLIYHALEQVEYDEGLTEQRPYGIRLAEMWAGVQPDAVRRYGLALERREKEKAPVEPGQELGPTGGTVPLKSTLSIARTAADGQGGSTDAH